MHCSSFTASAPPDLITASIDDGHEFIGRIDEYWEEPGAFGLHLETGAIAIGDRLGYELGVDFSEERVESLQIQNEPVGRVSAEAYIGVKTTLTKQQARKGTRVFRLTQ